MDYWERYKSPESLDARKLDQPIMRLVEDWENDRSAALVAQMMDPSTTAVAFYFAHALSPPAAVELFEPIVEQVQALDPHDWSEQADHWAIDGVRALYVRKEVNPADLENAVALSLDSAVATHIPLAATIRNRFLDPVGGIAVFDPEQTQRLVDRIGDLLTDAFADSPSGLPSALHSGSDFALWQLSWGLDRVRGERFEGLPFKGWQRFGDAMIGAARLDLRGVVHSITPFLVHHRHSFDVDHWEFDELLAERLFGLDVLRALFLGVDQDGGGRESRARRFQATQAGLA